MKTHRLSHIAGAVVLALGLSTAAMAADTSSSIRGSVLSVSGNVVTDATITIVHEPSGTSKTLKVNESGAFIANGLRVGGPYTVTIDSNAYSDKKLEGIYITLGDTFRLTETLDNIDMERIAVTGSSVFFDPSKGSSSTFSGDALTKSAAFNRDLKDIVKQNPMAVVSNDGQSLSLAGSNPRYNSLAVDGVNLNDDFGLAGNGYPTERSPIAFDSIDQISVAIAPFTAKEGGFSGGKISVVTKSGTNEFHGSIFAEQAQDTWAGTPENPETGEDIDLSFDEKTWGATLGGPIIKDKLFFFASYETFESPSSASKGPEDSNAAIGAEDVTQQQVDDVIRIAKEKYDFDAGDWNDSIPLEDEKYSLKLDWNINDDHRASFAYSHGFSNSAGNLGSGSDDDLYLSSHWYNRSNEYDTYVAQLYSYWSDNFSTEAKISYKESVNGQVPLGGYEFGEAKIQTLTGGEIFIGADDSRHANELTNETLQMRLSGEYLMDEHAISFGWEYEQVDVFNLFMQHYLGSWYYSSVADFEAGTAYGFEYQNNPSLNRDDAAAEFSLATSTFYVEDSWDMTDDFNLTYGIRYERTSSDDAPNLNTGFVDRYGFDNTENLDGQSLFLPRLGFTWNVADDLVVRGGAGRFSGGRPNVFISNSYTNDGSRIAIFQTFSDSAILDNADQRNIPQDALDSISDSVLGGPGSNIDAIDPDFEIPTTWQYSIAADYTADLTSIGLGEDWYISAEVLYKDIETDLIWSDLTRTLDTDKGNAGYTVDGRPIYTSVDESRDARDVLLSNTSGGHSLIETLSVAKRFESGISTNFSYTHSDIQDRIAATGTTTSTAYEFNPTLDSENPEIGTSSFETKHRFTFSLSYNAELVSGYNSNVSMFWERKSARPYSWVLGGSNTNRDEGFDGALDLGTTSLVYIPTGADDTAVDFVNGMSYDEIIADLNTIGASTSGGYLDKNSFRGPWTTTMDIRFEQELPGFLDGHKGIFYIDINNALALFDKKGAEVYQNPFGTTSSDLFDYSINDAGQYVYESTGVEAGDSPVQFQDRESTWSAKIGVKYSF
jgi:outer membrane receptor for ferrienterochelin and colicin